jgi:periplasmic protein TonB
VEGQVILWALIGKDGRIAELRSVRGPHMLRGPAMAAVRQWRFKPYELNGAPVEVETDIRLNFALPQE